MSTSAAKEKDGSIIISLANVDVDNDQDIEINVEGSSLNNVSGRIPSCKAVTDYNDFEHPDVVTPAVFKGAKLKKNILKVKIPAKSIVVLNLK